MNPQVNLEETAELVVVTEQGMVGVLEEDFEIDNGSARPLEK